MITYYPKVLKKYENTYQSFLRKRINHQWWVQEFKAYSEEELHANVYNDLLFADNQGMYHLKDHRGLPVLKKDTLQVSEEMRLFPGTINQDIDEVKELWLARLHLVVDKINSPIIRSVDGIDVLRGKGVKFSTIFTSLLCAERSDANWIYGVEGGGVDHNDVIEILDNFMKDLRASNDSSDIYKAELKMKRQFYLMDHKE